jgi:hypothetical protein
MDGLSGSLMLGGTMKTKTKIRAGGITGDSKTIVGG